MCSHTSSSCVMWPCLPLSHMRAHTHKHAHTRRCAVTLSLSLSIRSSQPSNFGDTGKKDLYVLCVKAVHFHMLVNLRESKWLDVFGSGVSPKGCWRTLYKPPIEKSSGDLQWRVVLCIIATNRHRAHIDPQVREECPLCGVQETVFHLFLNCSRLLLFFHQLEGYCQILGEFLTPMRFIYGPKYSRSKMQVHFLLSFIFGQGKLSIWLSRKGKLLGSGLIGLIKSHINIQSAYYMLINDLDTSRSKWGINQCICEINNDGCLQIYVWCQW